MNFDYIETNGIHLHVAQDGPEDGPLMILLHGFPEAWFSWKQQITKFAALGFRVWAPDQRGYNLSDKPAGISAYSLDELAKDIVGLIDASGQKQVYLIGHDWGAIVGWWLAIKYPDHIKKLIVLNVPHGAVMQKHMRKNFKQMLKSWYIFFFQLPKLPEFLARRNNWHMITGMLIGSSRAGTFKKADLDAYRLAWSQPGAMTSMINWYRAVIQNPPTAPDRSEKIKIPTLLIWGCLDKFLGKEMAQPSIERCENGKLVYIEDASHWVHHEEPDQVTDLIHSFIQQDQIESQGGVTKEEKQL